jgi:hypothetical protein
MAMTNQERFMASCDSIGEADVRQKLATNQYTDRRSVWASDWLEALESGKSDAMKAEERSSLLRKAAKPTGYARFAAAAVIVLGVASAIAFLKLRWPR